MPEVITKPSTSSKAKKTSEEKDKDYIPSNNNKNNNKSKQKSNSKVSKQLSSDDSSDSSENEITETDLWVADLLNKAKNDSFTLMLRW